MGSTTESSTTWQQDPEVSESLAIIKQRLSEEAINGPDGRRKLIEAARNLGNTLETPGESVQRLAYLVRPPFFPRKWKTMSKSTDNAL